MNQPVPTADAAPRRRRLMLWLVLVVGGIGRCGAARSAPSATEYEIKAAYLFKFLAFVEWPKPAFERPDTPLVVGLAGADMMADELAQLASARTVLGRPVAVRKLRVTDSPAELHVLFVARTDSARLPALARTLREHPILVVTEAEDAMPTDSAINFVIVDDKVRFDVALPTAERANLRISARLLTVARKVISGTS